MDFAFANCKSLKELPDISKWNTSNVIDMSGLYTIVFEYIQE